MKRNNFASGFGFQTLDTKLTSLLKPLFDGNKKEFLIINNLVKNWDEVIGKKYAKLCYPKSVNFMKKDGADFSQARLTIAVYNSSVGFFLQNNSEYLIEKIASLYGFKAINKVIIVQEPKETGTKIEFAPKLSKEKEEVLKNQIGDIKNRDLAKTLENLGRDILK